MGMNKSKWCNGWTYKIQFICPQMCSAWLAYSSPEDLSHLPYFLARLAPGMAYFIPVVIALATISPNSGHLNLPSEFRTGHQHNFYHIHCHRNHSSSSTRSDLTGPMGVLASPSQFPERSITQPAGCENLLSLWGRILVNEETEQGKAHTDKWLPSLSPGGLFVDAVVPYGFSGRVLWSILLNILEDGTSSVKHHLVAVLSTLLTDHPFSLTLAFPQ